MTEVDIKAAQPNTKLLTKWIWIPPKAIKKDFLKI